MSAYLLSLIVATLSGALLHYLAWIWLLYRWLPARVTRLLPRAANVLAAQLPVEDLLEKIADPRQAMRLQPFVEQHIDRFLNQRLQEKMPMIAMFVGEKTLASLKTALMDELHELLPQLIQQYGQQLSTEVDIPLLLEQQVNKIPREKILAVCRQSAATYQKYILIWGAATGLMAGSIVALLT